MATMYVAADLHPASDPRRVTQLLNRAAGDGWELVNVAFNPSRGMMQYYFGRTGGGASDVGLLESMFAEAARDAS